MRHLALAAALLLACGGDPHWDDPIEGAPRPVSPQPDRARDDRVILFGDLHVHTSYSWDGIVFALPMVGGEGVHPPADACDFARHCAALDFFALTDHAESLRPEHWRASVESIRQCNARAGDAADPDLVAYMGFEWSQAGLTPETHYGHRCVLFPGTADDELPARPIAAANHADRYARWRDNLSLLRWLQPTGWGRYGEAIAYFEALMGRPVCPAGADPRSLPDDCLEIAETPAELHARLDAWGLPALSIPHGTAWGTYTPATATLDRQLDPRHYRPDREPLIEIMSGHGSSEEYRSWRALAVGADGSAVCPEPSDDFLPCCWQAGEIMRARCGGLPEAECEARVAEARRLAAQVWTRPQQVFPDASPADWLDCDQCRDCFKPAYGLRPGKTVQYALALSKPGEGGARQRFRYGFVASSDNHSGRPGTGYKQIERSIMTDAVGEPSFALRHVAAFAARPDDAQRPTPPTPGAAGIAGADLRTVSFLYPGGLAAVHAAGRSREAIWAALQRREAYGTSGPRILLWFDLLNAPGGRRPMGSEVVLSEPPRFEVRALGGFVQQPGCPDASHAGLPADRLARLCRDECYHPGDARHPIVAIEVVRVRPQRAAGEDVGALIEDPWLRFDCEPMASGCVVRFEDPELVAGGRDAVYYVRALQEETPAINGDPLETRFDAAGRATATRPCIGPGTADGCPAPVQERAWSSPIFVSPGD